MHLRVLKHTNLHLHRPFLACIHTCTYLLYLHLLLHLMLLSEEPFYSPYRSDELLMLTIALAFEGLTQGRLRTRAGDVYIYVYVHVYACMHD